LKPRPNIFAFAPSELAQDAFLLWLASFADPDHAEADKALHELGTRFVQSLLDASGVAVADIKSVSVHKQVARVDLAIVVNGQIGLVIEDKTHTSDHSDQLKRYITNVDVVNLLGLVNAEQLYGIYLKTGNEATRPSWPDRWVPYTRSQLLAALGNTVDSGSDIARDFIAHLKHIDERTGAYQRDFFLRNRAKPTANWQGVEGFYQWLETCFPEPRHTWYRGWGYIPNPAGGYLGFWFGNGRFLREMADHKLHLQVRHGGPVNARLEKVDWTPVGTPDKYRALGVIQAASANSGINWVKPPKFGTGKSVAVAEVRFDGDEFLALYDDDGVFDEMDTARRVADLKAFLLSCTTDAS
jgi:hypothetical protein